MNKKVSFKIVLAYLVAGLVSYVAFGFAANRDFATMKTSKEASLIEMSGTLQCVMSEQNTGEACVATLTNAENGNVIALENAGIARKLFFEGKEKVAIRGRMTGNGALAIVSARAL